MAEDMLRRGFLAGLTVGGTALALEASGADAVVHPVHPRVEIPPSGGTIRAYTSLADWESQTENLNILEPVENDVNPSLDLVSSNTTLNVACYGDGADTTAVTVAGWTTGISNYIRIYTPVSTFEVGTSQRHAGTWNTSRYRLEADPPAMDTSVLFIQTNYVRVDGMQVWMTSDGFYESGIGVTAITGLSSYEISNNIVRGNGAGSQSGRIGINLWSAGVAGSTARIWNNIVYDFGGGGSDVAGILPDDADLTFFIFNNTVVDCAQGIAQYQGTVVAHCVMPTWMRANSKCSRTKACRCCILPSSWRWLWGCRRRQPRWIRTLSIRSRC